jgi:hypothetical protein
MPTEMPTQNIACRQPKSAKSSKSQKAWYWTSGNNDDDNWRARRQLADEEKTQGRKLPYNYYDLPLCEEDSPSTPIVKNTVSMVGTAVPLL